MDGGTPPALFVAPLIAAQLGNRRAALASARGPWPRRLAARLLAGPAGGAIELAKDPSAGLDANRADSMAALSFVVLLLGFASGSMWAFQRWPHHTSTIVLIVLYLLFGALHLFSAVSIVFHSSVLFGRDLPAFMSRLRKYRPISGSSLPFAQKWVGIVGVTILAQSIVIEVRWMSIAVMLLSVAAFHGARFMQPPFALYLATSGPQSRNLANAIVRACLPYQATNLRRIEQNRDIVDAFTKAVSTRQVTDLIPWSAAVTELTEIAKLIILDVRDTSESLASEIAIISAANAWFKTMLVVENDSNSHVATLAALSDECNAEVQSRARFVTTDDVVPLIKKLKASPKHLPTNETPIASFDFMLSTSNSAQPPDAEGTKEAKSGVR